MVGHGAEETVEKIVVGGVDLDAVEARLLDSVGGLAEGFHNGVDDFAAGFLGLAPFLPPPGAGRDQGERVELRVGVGTGMEELGEDLRAVGVQAARARKSGMFSSRAAFSSRGKRTPRCSSTQTISVMISPTPPLARAS